MANKSTSKKSAESQTETIAQKVANEEKADIYIFNGSIDDKSYIDTVQAISNEDVQDKCILLITTNGGSADAAYRIARWFQRFYKEFVVFPTGICASAGTLIAVGATNLIMSPFSELGPLDVQLTKRNELGERKSGLVTRAALDSLEKATLSLWEYFMLEIKNKSGGNISFDKCADIASCVSSAVFAEIYKQIDPDVLGQDDRDLNIALEYGKRLAKNGRNIGYDSIMHLVHEYPSHDFVIDVEESSELFNNLDLPSASLTNLVLELGADALDTRSQRKITLVKRLASAKLKKQEATDNSIKNGGQENEPN